MDIRLTKEMLQTKLRIAIGKSNYLTDVNNEKVNLNKLTDIRMCLKDVQQLCDDLEKTI